MTTPGSAHVGTNAETTKTAQLLMDRRNRPPEGDLRYFGSVSILGALP